MKYKKFIFLILFFVFLLPLGVRAEESYKDVLSPILDVPVEEGKINIYFFYGDGCPHCAHEERFLEDFKETYGEFVNIYTYETWYNNKNASLMRKAKEEMGDPVSAGVPYTVIGEESFVGYGDNVGLKIERLVKSYLSFNNEDHSKDDVLDNEEPVVDENKEDIPLLGEVDVRDVSVFLVAVVLGLVDGFNPCAMWVLLFLINMLIGMNDKKRMLIIGFVFLFTSAFMYFLFMLGISNILYIFKTSELQFFIGLIALLVGGYNVIKFLKERKDDVGCTVVDAKKRKKIFERIKKFTTEKSLFLALLGVVVLAISVNAVELACTSVFPATFSEILAVNNITGVEQIIYLIIYNVFYMLDDLVVFVIAVATLQLSTASSKYGKYSKLVAGLIMLVIGVLLMLKPEWLMFNF